MSTDDSKERAITRREFGKLASAVPLTIGAGALGSSSPRVVKAAPESGRTKVLLLDYSQGRLEAPIMMRWLPANEIHVIFVETVDSLPDDLMSRGFTHVVHSGSQLSVAKPAPFAEKAVACINRFKAARIPQFGICFGHQLLSTALAGTPTAIVKGKKPEIGWTDIRFTQEAVKQMGVREKEVSFMFHFEVVSELPKGARLMASTNLTKIAGWLHDEARMMTTQFHPEMDAESGNEILTAFKEEIAAAGFDVEELVKRKPSFDSGKAFFGHFLGRQW